jgi:hypothetical protein
MRSVAILLITAQLVCGGVLFSDDFNDGDDLGWTHYGGAGFQVWSGIYYIHHNGTGIRGISWSGDAAGQMSVPDYSMTAMVDFEVGHTAGIAVRYSSAGEWFYVLLLDALNDEIVLGRAKASGAVIPLDAVSTVIYPEYDCWMRLEVTGSSLGGKVWTGSLEDEPSDWLLLASNGSQPDAGSVALMVSGPGAAGKVTWSCGFDDVTVTDEITLPLEHGTWASIKALTGI